MLFSSKLGSSPISRLEKLIKPHCADMPSIKHNAQAGFYYLSFPAKTPTHINKLVKILTQELGFTVTSQPRRLREAKEYRVSIPDKALSLFFAEQDSKLLAQRLLNTTKELDSAQNQTTPISYQSPEQIMFDGISKWLLAQNVHKVNRQSKQFFDYANKFTVTASEKRIFVNFHKSCFRYHPAKQWVLNYLDKKLGTTKERKSYIDGNIDTGGVRFSLARDICEKAFNLEYSPASILKQQALEQARRQVESKKSTQPFIARHKTYLSFK